MLKLKGIVPPMITPFNQDGELDSRNLEGLLQFLKDKVDGLYICGSYGSGPLMSVAERKKVAEIAVKVIDGKIPIICHTGTTNTRDTVELTKHAEQIGCSGAAAVGPYYYHYKENSVLEFFSSMKKGVSPSFPLYVYHNPQFSGYEISLKTIKKLKENGLQGVKDATFNILTFAAYMRELSDDTFDVVLGTEAMWLPAWALGAQAFIPGLGNAFPEICRRMFQESQSLQIERARKTQFEINEIREVMYLAQSTQLAVFAMLEIRGIIKAYPRSPFIPVSQKEKDDIKRALVDLGVI